MTTSPDLTIVLHMGAHKTASTHLQQSFRDANAGLIAQGVRFYGPESLRQVGKTLPERFGFPFDPKKRRPDADPQAELARMRGDAFRVIFSEENFAGNFHRGWGKVPLPLYPAAADRIARLAQALGQKVDLCLAVRHPSDFLASLYSQILLSGKIVSPDEFLLRNLPSEVDWSDYVAQLRQSDGVGALTVWRYEDYEAQFAQICNALAGDAGSVVKPAAGRMMPRLSEAAVGAALSARLLDDKETAVRDLAEAYPTTAENPPFELFDTDLREIATEYYDMQIAAIADLPGVVLLGQTKTA